MNSLARDLRFDPAKLYREDGSLKPICPHFRRHQVAKPFVACTPEDVRFSNLK